MPGGDGDGRGSPGTLRRHEQKRARAAEKRTLEVIAAAGRRRAEAEAEASSFASVPTTMPSSESCSAGGSPTLLDASTSSATVSDTGKPPPPPQSQSSTLASMSKPPPPPPAVGVAATARLGSSSSFSMSTSKIQRGSTTAPTPSNQLQTRRQQQQSASLGARRHKEPRGGVQAGNDEDVRIEGEAAAAAAAAAAGPTPSLSELQRRLDVRATEAARLREHASSASDLEAEVRRLNARLDKSRGEFAANAAEWDELRDAMEAEAATIRVRLSRATVKLAEAEHVNAKLRDRAEEAEVAAAETMAEKEAAIDASRRADTRADVAEARVRELDGEMRQLEAENAALRARMKNADNAVEAEVAAVAEEAAEEAAESVQATFEKRLRAAAAALDEERVLRKAAETRAAAAEDAAGIGKNAAVKQAAAVAAAAAAAAAAERARGEERLRLAAAATVDAGLEQRNMFEREHNGDAARNVEREGLLEHLRSELNEARRELVIVRSEAAAAAKRNVGAVIVADAMRAGAEVSNAALAEDLLGDLADLDVAARKYRAAAAAAATADRPFTHRVPGTPSDDDHDGEKEAPSRDLQRAADRRVSTGEEMAAARGAVFAVPAFAPLYAVDPRRVAALAAACRVRTYAPGDVVHVITGSAEEDYNGDDDGEEVYLIMVGSGSLEVRPSKLNPFISDPAATYAAGRGDAIGEVSTAGEVLRALHHHMRQSSSSSSPSPSPPSSSPSTSSPSSPLGLSSSSLPPRAPAVVVCTSGPCRVFVLSSRDIRDVLVISGARRGVGVPSFSSSPGMSGGATATTATETARLLSESVSARLFELEAAAVTAAVGGGRVGADLNAPTTSRSRDYPLGVRWSAGQIAAATAATTPEAAGLLRRRGENGKVVSGGADGLGYGDDDEMRAAARKIIRRACAALHEAATDIGSALASMEREGRRAKRAAVAATATAAAVAARDSSTFYHVHDHHRNHPQPQFHLQYHHVQSVDSAPEPPRPPPSLMISTRTGGGDDDDDDKDGGELDELLLQAEEVEHNVVDDDNDGIITGYTMGKQYENDDDARSRGGRKYDDDSRVESLRLIDNLIARLQHDV